MKFYEAQVADIVRCTQRDAQFVETCQDDIFSMVEIFGRQNYIYLRKVIPWVANVWYYSTTSLNDLQTLGEEYTGTIRFTDEKKLPSKYLQFFWLVFYVGGEPMYDKCLEILKTKLRESNLSTAEKVTLGKFIQFLKDNKVVFMRIHNSMFYINSTYYNIANRLTGIKYILLRQWLQDSSASQSFQILGRILCAYLIFNIIRQLISIRNSASNNEEEENAIIIQDSTKMCALCADYRKNACSTPCGHIFCWHCIFDSIKYQPNCPICRKEINPSRIVPLQNYF